MSDEPMTTEDLHRWIDWTSLSSPTLVYKCADPWCDEVKHEPRPPVPRWTGPRMGWI